MQFAAPIAVKAFVLAWRSFARRGRAGKGTKFRRGVEWNPGEPEFPSDMPLTQTLLLFGPKFPVTTLMFVAHSLLSAFAAGIEYLRRARRSCAGQV